MQPDFLFIYLFLPQISSGGRRLPAPQLPIAMIKVKQIEQAVWAAGIHLIHLPQVDIWRNVWER